MTVDLSTTQGLHPARSGSLASAAAPGQRLSNTEIAAIKTAFDRQRATESRGGDFADYVARFVAGEQQLFTRRP